MFEEMPASEFPRFLAAFWEEKGWSTSVTENDDGTYLVGGDKDNGKRGLIGVRPSEDTEIGASEVEDFAAFCDKKGVDVRVMATRGRFTTGARSAADAGDVHLLDPNELASSVRDEGAEGLVEQFTDGDGGSLLDNVPSPPIPGGVPSGVPVVPIVVAVVVVLAAVFAGPTLLGFVPFVGGGGGGDAGPAFTAFSMAADENTTASAEWDVSVQDEIQTDANTYEPPEGETFVVVQLNVTAGDSQVVVRQQNFALVVNGTNYGYQRFENASQQFQQQRAAVTAAPGESGRLVVVFSVPAEFDGATLVERADGPGLRFQRADLDFDVE
ncbi:homolog to restriction system mrr [Halobacterium hubeiense]|uniref:Homolog to restriction system mrr n=2 Tax=Halobacterium TaxID=2239 RepID=A0A0U5GXW3_9EURY|nr:restriction endonuclease [Halobacterium hubeiense]CQH47839.1 homolog to restriction system mrr [Halobacterium hubeiense]